MRAPRACPYCSVENDWTWLIVSEVESWSVIGLTGERGLDRPLFGSYVRWDCTSCGFAEIDPGATTARGR